MSIYEQSGQKEAGRVFISYSSIDRIRVNGLGLLLEAMGHQVFHDHRTIKPGMRWQAALQEGLDDADVLLIFWTRHAASSDWVRKEYEYFAANYADRLLVPMLGDETPLTELLKTRQHADFAPVVNEVLELKRKMRKQGADGKAIEQAVLKRLDEAGIEIKEKDRRWIFLFLGFGWLLSLLRYPGTSAGTAGRAVVEKTAQLTLGQAAAIGAAALIGLGGSYPVAEILAEKDLRQEANTLQRENRNLQRENGRLREEIAGGSCISRDELNGHLDDISARLGDIAQCQQDIATLRSEIGRLGDGVVPRSERPGDPGQEAGGEAETTENGPNGFSRNGGSEKGDSSAEAHVEEPVIQFERPDAEGVFVRPRLIFDPEPEYPRSAKKTRVEGVVVVRGVIDENGKVSVQTLEVQAGPGQQALGDAARRAIGRWKFEPGTLDGKPVEVSLTVRVKFELRGVQRGLYRD